MESKHTLNKSAKNSYFKFQTPSLITLTLVSSLTTVSFFTTACSRDSQVQEDKKKLELVGYDFNQNGFFKAAAQDNLEALKIFKQNQFDLETTDLLGKSAVHSAAETGAVRALNFLSENKVNLESLDKHGSTPLILAAKNGQTESIKYLLNAKVETQMRDQSKKFALLHAIDANSYDAIKLLAPHNRELLDTAILYASDQNRPEAIKPLVQFGASVYARSQGMTSLMIAAMKGHTEVAQQLIEHGANPYAVSTEGQLARDFASDNLDMLAILQSNAKTTEEIEPLALEWTDAELEQVVRSAMERYHEEEIEALKNQSPEIASLTNNPNSEPDTTPTHNTPTDTISEVNTASSSSAPTATTTTQTKRPISPAEIKFTSIQGKSLAITAGSSQSLQNQMSMANYAEKPLPLIMDAEDPSSVQIKDLRSPQEEPISVIEGSEIGITGLKVKRIKKKIINSKLTGGYDKELVTLMVHDEKTGQSREIYSGYESSAADAVAVVKLAGSGEHLIVRRGDSFTDNAGNNYTISDVNELEVVVENTDTKEVTLLPLLGIKHQ